MDFGININPKSKSIGAESGSVNFGFSNSRSSADRLWTNNQTSLIATNQLNINTNNNTDIKGAIIANIINPNQAILNQIVNKDTLKGAIDGNNLTINTKTLTYSNINDYDYQESSGFSISANISLAQGGQDNKGKGNTPNNSQGQGKAPANNPNQQNNYYPNGSTTLSLQDQGSQKEQITRATIGNGAINLGTNLTFDGNGNLITKTGGLSIEDIIASDPANQLASLNRNIATSQEITKDTITGALDIETTIDNRLFAAAYEGASYLLAPDDKKNNVDFSAWNSVKSDFVNQGANFSNAILQNGELIDGAINLASRAATLDNYVYEGDLAREGLRQGIKGVIIAGNLTYQGVLLAGDMAYKGALIARDGTIDGALIARDGAIAAGDLTYNSSLLIPDALIGTNLSSLNPIISDEGKAGIRRTSQDAILGTLPWLSRWIDENNTVNLRDKNGNIVASKNYPAPNILPAFWNDPNMGISDPGCKSSTLSCGLWFGDSGILRLPHDIGPGSDSASGFHDAGNYPKWATQVTIPPYFAVNYLGSIGTILDIPNWHQNFVNPDTYIFKKVNPETDVQQIHQYNSINNKGE